MTGFDILAGAILLVSGLMGFIRGATREVVTVLAFVIAVIVSIFALRLSGPLAGHFIHTVWLARVAALLVVFIVVYIAVRLAGGILSRGVRQTVLSGPDRALGFCIGLARGIVAVGVIVLAIRAATPPERLPHWFTGARSYPLASAAGAALKAFAPKGMAMVRHVAPSVGNVISTDGTDADRGDSGSSEASSGRLGYTDKDRAALNVLVEKSRQ
ncbi:MAG TPA: CvpA family protein [Caulobacteraceae bacterium]